MIKEFLQDNSETKYAEFNSRLIKTKYKIYGVRLPLLKKFAKQLSLADFNLKEIFSFEEILLFGYCSSNLKNETEQLEALKIILPYIDNWCSCDCIVQALKKLNGHKSYVFFTNLLKTSQTFYIRVGIIGLMRYFLKSEFLNKILENLRKIKSDEYYVKMALAWFYAELCVTNIERAKQEISSIENAFIRNKSISKARESFRVSQKDKAILHSMKI